MMFYRKRPVVVEAREYVTSQGALLASWCGGVLSEMVHGELDNIAIPTLEGVMYALPGDWIIKGVKGEFYPCKSDIFKATYEPVCRPRSAAIARRQQY